MDRELLKNEFLKACNLEKAERIKLKADASYRRYERILEEKNSYILMDAPPEHEEVIPYIKIAKFLNDHELSAPKIMFSDTVNGLVLLEDFGDDSYNNILSGKSLTSNELNEQQLYEKAIDCLIKLHEISPSKVDIVKYSDDILIRESNQFIQWYVEILQGNSLSNDQTQEFNAILTDLFSYTKSFPEVVVLRDYHADNLMWLKSRTAFRKVGILDFQDALIGSIAYDLVSLLEDARRDVNSHLAESMITYYLKAFPQYSRKEFNAMYSILAVQRNLKIVGVFARQAVKNKNTFYLSLLPRVWRYINNDLKHPLLLPLKKYLIKIASDQIIK